MLQQTAKYKWHLFISINGLRLHFFAKIELYHNIEKPFDKNAQMETENIQLSFFQLEMEGEQKKITDFYSQTPLKLLKIVTLENV